MGQGHGDKGANFSRTSTFTHVRREHNSHADLLVNEAVDKALGKLTKSFYENCKSSEAKKFERDSFCRVLSMIRKTPTSILPGSKLRAVPDRALCATQR